MKIRLASSADLADLTAIYNYEIKFGTATFDTREKKLSERKLWLAEHNCNHHPLLVAEENGRLAGYASLSAYGAKDAFATTAELSVYVDPDHRGRGIGRSLIEALIKESHRDGFLKLLISVITSGNERSIALHKDLGFIYRGSIPGIACKFGQNLGIDIYTLNVNDD